MIPRHIVNFDTRSLPQKETDYLIIGSGIAGLYAALKASEFAEVTLLTKKKMGDTNTERAQGGIAAAIHSADSPALHRADTLEAGAGLCDVEAVEVLVNEGPDRVRELIEMGANFDRLDGELTFTREAAHSRRRILHAGDFTGEEIQNTLARRILSENKVHFLEDHMVIDLLTDGNKCYGALVWDNLAQKTIAYFAKITVLATGGAGQVFQNTTNPEVATGDGTALAFRAGAAVMDMEFVQFHPTALSLPGAPRFLISEAVRGEGALLRNIHGERFMPRYHPGAELAARDIVARSIFREMAATGTTHVFLDLSPITGKKVKKRFPTIARTCFQYGIDIAREMIPVAPAAHYMMGGIQTNLDGETSVAGLYACGEAACQGVHGANRLASNSLLDGLVFGHRIVDSSKPKFKEWRGPHGRHFSYNELLAPQSDNVSRIKEVREVIQRLMWENVGIIRDENVLRNALNCLEQMHNIFRFESGCMEEMETYNILVAATLITYAALTRGESRGGHCRVNYGVRDDVNWKKHMVIYRDSGGEISAYKREVT
ncbi:L-aspartate oxidase [Phosphitispora fastidiosa]|uniref:L-aspartate oxidase n=1 Tax=Phosphitispora fastidiosa TaxID=2837202 RepID=UPI001E2CC31A|nr:L-aspartate oxidase [Phosphitispora fastidiosa]MBU7007830.1 L-aspartate oxidase [Phosphitispora fastidiosa]